MFSTKLNRVAQRAPAVAAISNSSSTAAHRPSPCIATRRPHQRRHSSSKASCPPDSSAGGKPAPTTKAAAAASDANAAASKASISDEAFHSRAKRATRSRKARAPAVERTEDRFAGLPSVRGTQAWRYDDFSMSSFFSLHRPLSLASTIPRQATADEFASIFEAKHQGDAWANGNSAERRPEDVIYTLHPSLQGLSSVSFAGQEESSSWDMPQEGAVSQDAIKHLDGPPPMKSLDDVLSQFQHMPYKAPPPPQPFPEDSRTSKKRASKSPESLEQQLRDHISNMHKTRQRKYQTTITMTESTTEDGHTLLLAERTPFVQIPSKQQAEIREPRQNPRMRLFPQRPARMTCLPNRGKQSHRVFLATESMQWIRRAPTQRVKMILISVKRQRKLKMKKHKYKKLMKRTRTLRRKQDRA